MEVQVFERLAEFGILAVIVGFQFWYILRKDKDQKEMMDTHRIEREAFIGSIKENTDATRETKTFLQTLNGTLRQAIRDKVGK